MRIFNVKFDELIGMIGLVVLRYLLENGLVVFLNFKKEGNFNIFEYNGILIWYEKKKRNFRILRLKIIDLDLTKRCDDYIMF